MKVFQTIHEKMPVIYFYSPQERDQGSSSLERVTFEELPEICKKMFGPLFEGFSLILWDQAKNVDDDRGAVVNAVADEISGGGADQRIALVELLVDRDIKDDSDLILEFSDKNVRYLAETAVDILKASLSLKAQSSQVLGDDTLFGQPVEDRFTPLRLRISERVLSYAPVVGVPEPLRSLQIFRMLTPILSGLLKTNEFDL